MPNFSLLAIKNLIMMYSMKVIIGLVILFVGFKISNFLSKRIEKVLDKKSFDNTLKDFIKPFINIAFKTLVVLTVISYMGIEVTSFVAIIGAIGFAIGLAFQGALSNFAGGVLLIILRPFQKDDFIEVAGYKGTVENISIFYTNLRTPDNKLVVLPNSSLTSNSLINYSKKDKRRVDFIVGVDYDSDIKEVKETINKMADENDKILQDPKPFVRLGELGDSSINFYVRFWAKSENYWDVYFDFNESLKETFDAKGIEFPYPHMDVNIYDDIKAKDE